MSQILEPVPLGLSVDSRPQRPGRQVKGWEELAASSGSLPTQDIPWAIAGVEAFGGDSKVVVCGDPIAPDAAAPFALEDGHLELAGARQTGEPADLLGRSPEALGDLTDRLVSDGRPIFLPRIPAGSPTIAALRESVGRRGVVRVSAVSGHPTVALTDVWQEPGGGLSSSRRSALRRARRRAEKTGEVTAELVSPAPHEVASLLEDAFAVEARSWKRSAGTALLQAPALADFFRRYASEAAARGTLRLEFLRIGGVSVAMQFGVEWQRRIWLFKIGYDERYAAASPGQLLLAESIADAARRGLDGYELLGTAARWTEPWAPRLHSCVRVVAYPATRHGFASLASAAGRQARERARERTSALARRVERIAASRYVAGPDLSDALDAETRCAVAGYATTVGHWDCGDETAAAVTDRCLAAADALPPGSELSIKYSSLTRDSATLDALLANCRTRGVGLHFDALAPDTVDAALREAERLAATAPGEVGCTLPGRWLRSAADAQGLADRKLRARVVKGEWVDPEHPDRDPGAGLLEVVGVLAGRDGHVAVATQDAALAVTALERLIDAGTPCELQVLYAMRSGPAVRAARRLGVPIRVYIPYGFGRVPYPLERDARTLARLAFDLLPGEGFAPPGTRMGRL